MSQVQDIGAMWSMRCLAAAVPPILSPFQSSRSFLRSSLLRPQSPSFMSALDMTCQLCDVLVGAYRQILKLRKLRYPHRFLDFDWNDIRTVFERILPFQCEPDLVIHVGTRFTVERF